ncbi:hypothetical protein [Nostoc sp.]
MKDCQDVLELNSDISGFAYIDLANKLYEQNRTDLALLMCNEAIGMSNSPVAYETMGYILYSEGKQDAGIKYINKAVKYYAECKMFEKIEQLHKDLQEMKRANHPLGKVLRWLFEKQGKL